MAKADRRSDINLQDALPNGPVSVEERSRGKHHPRIVNENVHRVQLITTFCYHAIDFVATRQVDGNQRKAFAVNSLFLEDGASLLKPLALPPGHGDVRPAMD